MTYLTHNNHSRNYSYSNNANANIFRQARESIHDIETTVMHLLPRGMKQGHEWVALNPTRDDDNTGSFRINLITGKWADFATGDKGGDIVSLLAYLRGISYCQAALEIIGKRSNCQAFTHPDHKTRNGADDETRANKTLHIKTIIDRIWRKSLKVDGSPVEHYLKSRGLAGSLARGLDSSVAHGIRYHPRLYHAPTQSFYPAMVAIIFRWSDKASLGLHRTYLKESHGNKAIDGGISGDVCIGKADIFPNKMMLGNTKGGAVMLAYPEKNKPLIIAEGIETALSVYVATNLPTWAALSASGMINVEVPPPDITPNITIAADYDSAGMYAANKLADRLLKRGYKVKIAHPPVYGTDFNDLLLAEDRGEGVEDGDKGDEGKGNKDVKNKEDTDNKEGATL